MTDRFQVCNGRYVLIQSALFGALDGVMVIEKAESEIEDPFLWDGDMGAHDVRMGAR